MSQMSRQAQYEAHIRRLVNEIRNKDSEIERLASALRATNSHYI